MCLYVMINVKYDTGMNWNEQTAGNQGTKLSLLDLMCKDVKTKGV